MAATSLTLALEPSKDETWPAFSDSIGSLAQALNTLSDSADDLRHEAVMLGDNPSEVARVHALFGSASPTTKFCVRLEPTERYLELVAAVERSSEGISAVVRHGWPILSVVVATTTVTEGRGESIAPAGGCACQTCELTRGDA